VVHLLNAARSRYVLRNAGRPYDLKVTFTVNSGGQTEYDGAWQMEDVFDPQQGLHWTATAAAGYTTTQISKNGKFSADGSANTVPLRLHEARAALFDPLPTAANVDRSSIRTSTASYNGAQVTCVLLSSSGNAAASDPGRDWEETETCIDPQSGALLVHSQVPGRYYAYDYSNAPRLGDSVLPRKVTVTEGGRVVSEISVESLTELPAADPGLFVTTEKMRARGAATAMAGAQKITRVVGRTPVSADATAYPVVVFGLVTPAGKLAEAHSLQPSDPNSQAAVDAAKRIKFSSPAPRGERPQQHFVFIIEKFVGPQ
jgi:hypothetical protein